MEPLFSFADEKQRRLSAKLYFSAAKIISKRARKGFGIKLNPDAHWSCAFYKGLDWIQKKDGKDGTNKCILSFIT